MTGRLLYTIVVQPLSQDDGGGYLATVPDLPGCMTDGETPEEALNDVANAIAAWIEAAHDVGHPVPEPSSRTAETLLVRGKAA